MNVNEWKVTTLINCILLYEAVYFTV